MIEEHTIIRKNRRIQNILPFWNFSHFQKTTYSSVGFRPWAPSSIVHSLPDTLFTKIVYCDSRSIMTPTELFLLRLQVIRSDKIQYLERSQRGELLNFSDQSNLFSGLRCPALRGQMKRTFFLPFTKVFPFALPFF